MSSGPGSFSRHNHLSELNSPLVTAEGVLSPSERRARVIENIFGEEAPEPGVTFPDDLTVEGNTVLEGTFTLGATVVGATGEEINAAADGSANTVVVAAGGAAVTALAGGGTYLVPLVTANVTFTLPASALGEKHKFVFIGSAADAEDWVITSPSLFVGGPAFFDVGGTSAAVYANGSTHNTLTVNNPAAGTEITFIGDGTDWAVTGTVSSADTPAFTAV